MSKILFERIPTEPIAIEDAGSAYQLRWYGEHDVAVYNILSNSAQREDIDLFIARVLRMIREWPAHKPYLVIYVIERLNWSPYIRTRTQEAFDAVPKDMRGRLATVLPRNPLAQIVRLMLRRQYGNPLEMDSFNDINQAAHWVETLISIQKTVE